MVVYCGQGLWSVVAYIWDRQLPGCLLIMSKFPARQLLEASVMKSANKTCLEVRYKGTALDYIALLSLPSSGGRQGTVTSYWDWLHWYTQLVYHGPRYGNDRSCYAP